MHGAWSARGGRACRPSLAWTLLVVVVALVGSACTPGATEPVQVTRPLAVSGLPERPNLVLFLTDDQVVGTTDAMPTVQREIIDKGVDVANAVIPTSTCCPSRVALLTGQHAHSNGVYKNVGRSGGWTAFDKTGGESRTIAVALRNAGYRTGFYGKYLNGWVATPEDYVPAGWDEFMAIRDPFSSERLGANAYYNYWLTGTEPKRVYGDAPEDYSTDVVAMLATEFVESTDEDQPLFLVYSTTGPHAPFTPAPRHAGTRSLEPLPEWFSNDVDGKPPWLASREPVQPLTTRRDLRDQKQALASVDEGIRSVMDALGDRVTNTLFVFMSDNGLQLGSHRLRKKYVPYARATMVPMAMRFDGVIEKGTTLTSLVANVDVTATLADAAGATMTNMDGRSVLSDTRDSVVLEGAPSEGRPAYCGTRTTDYLYVQHSSGSFEELYDYRVDPHEATNIIGDPEYAEVTAQLRNEARQKCLPTPPGFDW